MEARRDWERLVRPEQREEEKKAMRSERWVVSCPRFGGEAGSSPLTGSE